MNARKFTGVMAFLLTAVLGLNIMPAAAHQPLCETTDLTAQQPLEIEQPTISKALYATLHTPDDVDYFTFSGQAGDSILLGIVIPQLAGQELFAPQYALLGPGLPQDITGLPDNIVSSGYDSMFTVPPLTGTAETFFEPFSRTSYWTRQEETITLTESGEYSIVLWHPSGEIGRYVLVVGSREVFGGDLGCYNENNYWSPLTDSGDAIDPPAQRESLFSRFVRSLGSLVEWLLDR